MVRMIHVFLSLNWLDGGESCASMCFSLSLSLSFGGLFGGFPSQNPADTGKSCSFPIFIMSHFPSG